ncbi:MAG TPA: AMP-binding protein, partial [Vicinamibacterales bacterium]|nr:AMP-binding protein [Vicinamibacterales bacterium]
MSQNTPPAEIADLLQEDRSFAPSPAFQSQANVRDEDVYARADRDPEAFWAEFAGELEWFSKWTTVLDWKPPHAKWFVGGTLNASVNCVDRHVRGSRRNKAAIVWEGEPGDRRTLTYFDLYRQVSQFANVMRSLGIKRGDRVAIYLPLVPELAIAMLACARIGAVHSVVFGGFSSESLRDRINDAQA